MPRQACRLSAAITLLLLGATAVRADIAPPFGFWHGGRGPLPPHPPALCTKVRIHSVDSAHLERHGDKGTLSANGAASAAGWHDAELRLVAVDHSEAGATAIYELVACPPEINAEVSPPLAAATPLALPPAQFHRIVIKAETNEQTVHLDAPLPRP